MITRNRYTDLVGLAIIILLGIIIYSNSFQCSFHFDDFHNIVENPTIRNLTDVKAWWNFYPTRPFGMFTFAVNYHFNQLDVRYWHIVNLCIHLINACLVWWLTLLIFSSPPLKDNPVTRQKNVIALFTALLFVSHPLATQSVTYIVQRLSSMTAMFYLLSLSTYVQARLSNKGNGFKVLLFTGSFVSAVLAMLTKENAFTLPFSVLLIELFFLRKKKFSLTIRDYRMILFIAASLCILLIIPVKYSFSVLKPIPPTQGNTYTITSLNYLFTQFSVIVKYIQLLFLPISQNVDYDFPVSNKFLDVRTLLSFLVLLSLFLLAIILYPRNRIISFGIFWFFLTLSIESSFIPIRDVIFEHRTYLPSFGFCLVLSTGISGYLRDKYKGLSWVIMVIMVILYSSLTFERNKVWKDNLTLWNDNVLKSPGKARPIVNRGYAYGNLGDWDKAIADYTKGMAINPEYSDAYNNRGFAYGKTGQWEKSVADYSKAISLDPKFVIAWLNRGIAYDNLEQREKAIADYSEVIRLDPKYAIAWYNRGADYDKLGQKDKAVSDYSMAVEIDPNSAIAYSNRGVTYSKQGQWDKAIEEYSSAIGIDPKNLMAYFNRADAYGNLGQFDKAIEDYSMAITIDPGFAKAYSNRGIAYASLKQWEKALADCDQAIRSDPKFAQAYYNRGIVYANLGQWNRVIADCSMTIEIDPSFVKAYSNRGAAFGNMGQMDKAISDYSKAIEIDPEYATAYYNRAVAYETLGQRERANADYAKAIKINPKYQEAYNARHPGRN
jgi:protein O-mannosyl-transferase